MVYSALVTGVHFGSAELGLDGVWCGDLGVRRRLSGKPTCNKCPIKNTNFTISSYKSNTRTAE